MIGVEIRMEYDVDGTIAEDIEHRLIEALRQDVPPSDGKPLTVLAREGAALVGGLIGSTSYGWLLVKMLWVAEGARGCGFGATLVAEAEARERGCHGAWLDTSNSRAERFYARLGYEPFGVLQKNAPAEHPHGHRRAFLRKPLRPAHPDSRRVNQNASTCPDSAPPCRRRENAQAGPDVETAGRSSIRRSRATRDRNIPGVRGTGLRPRNDRRNNLRSDNARQ